MVIQSVSNMDVFLITAKQQVLEYSDYVSSCLVSTGYLPNIRELNVKKDKLEWVTDILERYLSCKYSLLPSVRSDLTIHLLDTPFVIQQPIQRPCLLERVYKPICTPHWCGVLPLRALEIGCK